MNTRNELPTSAVALIYCAIALIMTWPLATHLSSHLAGDLGDPAFNCWIMMWTAGQVFAFVRGDLNALHDYWNGNIFYPAKLTIAYSEHLTPQMVQILPLYAATGNILLCYNLLFLSTFVLAGLGAYLLVRELTGKSLAAFFAGLAFAYAPYRIAQIAHIQVLSVQWMPLALYGFRRYFVTGRRRPLVGGSVALWLQNLSCGYFLLYFSPFAAAYCLYEMTRRRLLTSARTWLTLSLAACAIIVLTWPFVTPYLEVRRTGDVGVRTYNEMVVFSADTHAFAVPPGPSRLWGGRNMGYFKPEAEGLPGVTIALFATVGIGWGIWRGLRTRSIRNAPLWHSMLLSVCGVAWLISAVVLAKLFFNGDTAMPFGRVSTWIEAFFALLAIVITLVQTLPRRDDEERRSETWQSAGFFSIGVLVAAFLALGPTITVRGRAIGPGPYYLLSHYVPGFDGLRVSARYLMIVALFLAVLAGIGAAMLLRRYRRAGAVIVAVGCIGVLTESWMAPMRIDVRLAVDKGLNKTPMTVETGSRVSPLYELVRSAPPRTVLIEFPFGEQAYEILADFYAGYHRKPIVNGYSGFFSDAYFKRATFLNGIPKDWDAATKAVRYSLATMALVHEEAFLDGRGKEISRWLEGIGARLIASDGGDRLFAMPPPPQ